MMLSQDPDVYVQFQFELVLRQDAARSKHMRGIEQIGREPDTYRTQTYIASRCVLQNLVEQLDK